MQKHSIGLELFSVRTELERDLPNTLKTVAGFGYEVVEFYAPYYDWSVSYAKDVRTLMDDIGLRCCSTHNHIQALTPGDGLGRAIELNQILGAKIIVLASAPEGVDGLEGWKKLCGKLSAVSGQLKPHGLAAGFHNHQTQWARLDGKLRTMDVLAANTPREFVLQLDVGTCVEAGADPVAWINANPGRIPGPVRGRRLPLESHYCGGGSQRRGGVLCDGTGRQPLSGIRDGAPLSGGMEGDVEGVLSWRDLVDKKRSRVEKDRRN